MATIGYARVSSTGQSLDIQLAELEAAGCERVFQEKTSGATTDNRTELAAMIEFAREGDTVVITKLDRLARSMRDFLDIVEQLKAVGCGIRVLATDGLSTDTPTGNMILNVLGSIAEFERELLRERQQAGIEAAKAKGVYKGRKPTAPAIQAAAVAAVKGGKNKAEVARDFGITRATLYKFIRDAGGEAA